MSVVDVIFLDGKVSCRVGQHRSKRRRSVSGECRIVDSILVNKDLDDLVIAKISGLVDRDQGEDSLGCRFFLQVDPTEELTYFVCRILLEGTA